MITEKLTTEEWALYEIIRNPVWFGEFVHSMDEKGGGWQYTDYQKLVLLDFSEQVSFRAGRAVGKTVTMITKIAWHAVNKFYDSTLFTVPNRAHLDPVFMGIQKWFRTNTFLQYWIGRFSVNSQQFIIKFVNNFTWICRIAGTSGTGVNVVGLHLPIIMVDESGYYPWGTWLELQQVINDWEPGHQVMVAGVPDGRRERSVCFMCDTAESFSKHAVSAYQNPRFTKESEQRALEQFGGRESPDFIQQVLGEHGSPTFTLFDRQFMSMNDYDCPVIRIRIQNLQQDPQILDRLVYRLPLMPKFADKTVFGIDLGYNEPTAIMIFYKRDSQWYVLCRIELYQVSYDLQENFFVKLESHYDPDYIGLDVGAGGQGKAIYHNLINRDEYKSRKYMDKILPVEFGGTVVVGYDADGKELKERVKHFAATRLAQLVNAGGIVFATRDDDLISELERVTYTTTVTGQVVYKVMTEAGSDRGFDHNFSALLTFSMVLFEKIDPNDLHPKAPKLFNSRWLIHGSRNNRK